MLPALVSDLREPLPLFVYGTLADTEFAGHLLEHPVAAVGARLPGFEKIWPKGCDYPTIVECEEAWVEGTLYRGLNEEDFRRIDAYEGVHEGLYQRARVQLEAGDREEPELGWVYLATAYALTRVAGR